MSALIDSPEEVLSTLTKEGKRRWLYPKLAPGSWWNKRRIFSYALIVIYVVAPFITIGGNPLILLDIVNRRFTVAGQMFIASDTVLLLFLILSLILVIVTASAIAGRVWCGWACPQTVYLEFVFRPIENLIEGSPSKRKKRDEGPVTFDVVWRKALKYVIYALIALILANAFIAYFVGSKELIRWMQMSPAEHPIPFMFMSGITAAILFDFAYFREQMCTIACPYARLQSVLLDKHSVIVGYDKLRGEPRGRGKDRDGKGDCVECNLCVAVCPMGIDIRNGLQLECVHCTQCIDACDSIMSKVGKPAGLIRYSSTASFNREKTKVIRPRVVLYGLLLCGFVATLFSMVATRESSEAQLLRRNAQPFTLREDGLVTNHLRVKIVNHSGQTRNYSIEVIDPGDFEVVVPLNPIQVADGEGKQANLFISGETSNFQSGQYSGKLKISDGDTFEKILPYTLVGPQNNSGQTP